MPKFKFKSARKNKINLIESKSDVIENEILGAQCQLFSNRELVVDGCVSIFEYSESYIKLNLCKGTLSISGSMLNISSFENDIITVKGTISNLEFC